MRKILSILTLGLLSASISAQENKYELNIETNGFSYLSTPIIYPNIVYNPQIFYYMEFKVVNKTNEPLVDVNIVDSKSTFVVVEYDKEYKLTPITTPTLYKKVNLQLKNYWIASFQDAWKPNDTLTYKIIFAKEITEANKGELLERNLEIGHLQYPPKRAELYINITAKGIYGDIHKQSFKADLKDVWNNSVPKIQEYYDNIKKEEAAKKAESEAKKTQQKKQENSSGGGIFGKVLDLL